jgi:hypothetical protein
VKVAVFNEEQLWHHETGRGPADHPLLQLNQPDYGFRNLTKDEADAIDEAYLREHLRAAHQREDDLYAEDAAAT